MRRDARRIRLDLNRSAVLPRQLQCWYEELPGWSSHEQWARPDMQRNHPTHGCYTVPHHGQEAFEACFIPQAKIKVRIFPFWKKIALPSVHMSWYLEYDWAGVLKKLFFKVVASNERFIPFMNRSPVSSVRWLLGGARSARIRQMNICCCIRNTGRASPFQGRVLFNQSVRYYPWDSTVLRLWADL